MPDLSRTERVVLVARIVVVLLTVLGLFRVPRLLLGPIRA